MPTPGDPGYHMTQDTAEAQEVFAPSSSQAQGNYFIRGELKCIFKNRVHFIIKVAKAFPSVSLWKSWIS